MSETRSQLNRYLPQAESFYDVITILYQVAVAGGEEPALPRYLAWKKKGPAPQTGRIDRIVRWLATAGVSGLSAGVKQLLALYGGGGEDLLPLVVETLLCFNTALVDILPPRTLQVDRGCLNDPGCPGAGGARLYLASRNVLQARFFQKNHLFDGRKLQATYSTGLWSMIRNYIILQKDDLGGFFPQIRAYYPEKGYWVPFQDGSLRMAVFSFGNRRWFSVSEPDDGGEFSICYTSAQEEEILDAYKRALVMAERQRADMAVLPELALGASLREKLQEHLRSTVLTRRYPRLIFTGSRWVNGENTAYIFTGGGLELLSQKKRLPFSPHDVSFYAETGTDPAERLRSSGKDLAFLDVPGLGRISYVICRDFLSPAEREHLRADLLGSKLIVASCYTGETESFRTQAEALARGYGAVVLMVNACAALEDRRSADRPFPLAGEPQVGFLTVPVYDAGTKAVVCRTFPCTPYTAPWSACARRECGLCACMDVYTLSFPADDSRNFSVDHRKYPQGSCTFPVFPV